MYNIYINIYILYMYNIYINILIYKDYLNGAPLVISCGQNGYGIYDVS